MGIEGDFRNKKLEIHIEGITRNYVNVL